MYGICYPFSANKLDKALVCSLSLGQERNNSKAIFLRS